MKEADMFPMLKQHFEQLNYKVNAEVKSCDLTAIKDGELIVVEMKTSLNITLLYQALERKKLTPYVFIAIPKPKRDLRKNLHKMKNLLSKLQIGLIVVDIVNKDVIRYLEPEEDGAKLNYKKKSQVLKEIGKREVDENIGGINKTKILTGYKELGISLCCVMSLEKEITTHDLRNKYGFDKDVTGYLNKNFFAWFHKVGRGKYILSSRGEQMLLDDEFKNAIEYYHKKHLDVFKKNNNLQ